MSTTAAEESKEQNPNTSPKAEAKELPRNQNQAQGAAWAGGISGFFVGGPIGAALLGWLSWRLASRDNGSSGNFCRKAGDFANRLGNSIRGEWDKCKPIANKEKSSSDDQEEPKVIDRSSFQQTADYFVDKGSADKVVDTYTQTSNFTNRVYGSIKGEWNKAAESCAKEEEEDAVEKSSLIPMKTGGFLHKSSKVLAPAVGYLRKTWDESKSVPLVEAEGEVPTKYEVVTE